MTMKKTMAAITAMLFAIAMTSFAAFAAGGWEGVWKVKDSAGQPFKITLSADGNAKASLHKEMVGTWKEEGDAAVITWKTGWTTKIVKEGKHYKKMGYRQGQPLDGPPSNSSAAKKVK
jgi:hypothetical protein